MKWGVIDLFTMAIQTKSLRLLALYVFCIIAANTIAAAAGFEWD